MARPSELTDVLLLCKEMQVTGIASAEIGAERS